MIFKNNHLSIGKKKVSFEKCVFFSEIFYNFTLSRNELVDKHVFFHNVFYLFPRVSRVYKAHITRNIGS